MAGPSVQAAADHRPTWPRRAEGDAGGTPALWAPGLGRRTIMSDIDGIIYNVGWTFIAYIMSISTTNFFILGVDIGSYQTTT